MKKNLFIWDVDRYNETLRLVGDEDTGVSMDCRLCDRGGLPIAYLLTSVDDDGYIDNEDVLRVGTITELINAGQRHHQDRHPHGRRRR